MQVKIFVGATQTYAANDSNVQVFKDDKFAAKFMKSIPNAHKMREQSEIDLMKVVAELQSTYCDDSLNDADLMEEIRHADLIVGEFLYLCSSLVADKLSLPHVVISASSVATPTAIVLGLPSPPSYVPQCRWYAHYKHAGMNFMDRVQNVLQWMKLHVVHIYYFCPMFNKVKAKHNITPNKSVQETLGRVDMIISQMDFTLEPARPLLPSEYNHVCLVMFVCFVFFFTIISTRYQIHS